MKFFLPISKRDRIVQGWNPIEEMSPEDAKKLYIWEVFEDPPIDGVLVSRNVFENAWKNENRDIHEILNYNGIIFGDCGAWGYIKEPKPLYKPEKTLEYYSKVGFDLACSIDHLILSKFDFEEKKKRQEITWHNAQKMFKIWEEKYQNFKLVGVAQGWDVPSYLSSIRQLLELGYQYIAIGGTARSPTKFIRGLLNAIGKELRDMKKNPRIHLFGVARWKLFDIMKNNFIESIDSATMLRRGWLGHKNYHLEKQAFTVPRIPPTDKRISASLQQSTLTAMRKYAKGQATLERTLIQLRKIKANTRFMTEIEKTLKERVWTRCDCVLCTNFGVDIAIFRMGERNMRRGFHNVYQFHRLFSAWKRDQINLSTEKENVQTSLDCFQNNE